jgi:hypothetical protein
MLIPGILDHYLADYASQQAPWPVEPDRPDNLFQTVEGDYGAQGEFNDKAMTFSPQAWAVQHPSPLFAIAGGLAGWALAAWAASGREHRERRDQRRLIGSRNS